MTLSVSLALAVLTWTPGCHPVAHNDPAIRKPTYAYADPAGCAIYLRRDWRRWSKWWLCTVVVHEVGHVAGYTYSDPHGQTFTHSPDPTNVMYGGLLTTYRRCLQALPPGKEIRDSS